VNRSGAKGLTLAAMIAVVAMMFIDQTIVAIAVPGLQALALFDAVQLDFAHSLRTVFFIMAAVMAVAFVVALVAVPRGRAPEAAAVPDAEPQPAG
jgi:hypothetical protein